MRAVLLLVLAAGAALAGWRFIPAGTTEPPPAVVRTPLPGAASAVVVVAAPAPAAAATADPVPDADPLTAAVTALEGDVIETAASDCLAALEAAAQGSEGISDEAEQGCAIALAGLSELEARPLAQGLVRLTASPRTLTLALELADTEPDAEAWLDLARQLLTAAGALDAGFDALDARSFAAGYAATARAAAVGSDEAKALLVRLEEIEFPLRGARLEPLWRALYFGRFVQIEDSFDTRRHVSGVANALSALCGQWEPPGIGSVEFDNGLELYLAPVRAQVPGRMLGAAPKVGKALGDAWDRVTDSSREHSGEQWLTEAYKTVQDVQKPLQNSVAVSSVAGRDAAQILFTEVHSCRSPRGSKFIHALIRYFRHNADSQPREAGTVVGGQEIPFDAALGK